MFWQWCVNCIVWSATALGGCTKNTETAVSDHIASSHLSELTLACFYVVPLVAAQRHWWHNTGFREPRHIISACCNPILHEIQHLDRNGFAHSQ